MNIAPEQHAAQLRGSQIVECKCRYHRLCAGGGSTHDGRRSSGRYAEAEPLLKRALTMREKALGIDHSDVGQS